MGLPLYGTETVTPPEQLAHHGTPQYVTDMLTFASFVDYFVADYCPQNLLHLRPQNGNIIIHKLTEHFQQMNPPHPSTRLQPDLAIRIHKLSRHLALAYQDTAYGLLECGDELTRAAAFSRSEVSVIVMIAREMRSPEEYAQLAEAQCRVLQNSTDPKICTLDFASQAGNIAQKMKLFTGRVAWMPHIWTSADDVPDHQANLPGN